MTTLSEVILRKVKADPEDLEGILARFSIQKLAKGAPLLTAGKPCQSLFFIETGYVRMFTVDETGREITTWLGGNGQFITATSSFAFQTPNIWNIEALTTSTVHLISRANHFELCDLNRKWLEFENLLLTKAFAGIEQRMFGKLHTTAQERFDQLFAAQPALFNHVPLQYIASWLGMTSETLSRIRKVAGSPS